MLREKLGALNVLQLMPQIKKQGIELLSFRKEIVASMFSYDVQS